MAAEKDEGIDLGVKGTPTFFVNGERVQDWRDYGAFAKLIDEALRRWRRLSSALSRQVDDRRAPYVLIALALLGLAISTYLVTTHYGKQPIACAGVGDCTAVNSSQYANVGGVPVSLLGIGLYAGLASLAYYWSLRPRDDGRMIAYWGLALSGAGYAAYLTYIEIAVLNAICVWCVASATILATSLVASTIVVFSNPEGATEPARPSRRIVS